MGRYRILSDEERLAHTRASNTAWARRNIEYLRERDRLRAPARREQRAAAYAARRQALLDSGWVPRPVGRPRIHPDTEALELKREANRDYMRRRRARVLHHEPTDAPTDSATDDTGSAIGSGSAHSSDETPA